MVRSKILRPASAAALYYALNYDSTTASAWTPGAKTIKKNPNSSQNKSQTHRAKQYEVTSFLSTDCELSTETWSKNVYSLGPRSTAGLDNEQEIYEDDIYLLRGIV